jgi:hypothetical protein
MTGFVDDDLDRILKEVQGNLLPSFLSGLKKEKRELSEDDGCAMMGVRFLWITINEWYLGGKKMMHRGMMDRAFTVLQV